MDIPFQSDEDNNPGPGKHDTTCIPVDEPEETNWHDNWLCMPSDSPYGFEWSAEGTIAIVGKECIRIYDGLQDGIVHWQNNYLCAYEGNRR